jgi:hypothetical protein
LHLYYEIIDERHSVFHEPEDFHRDQKLYRDREFHGEPLEHPIYDHPYEEIDTCVYPAHEIQTVDEAVPLGQEDYAFVQTPTQPIDETIEIRPMVRPRRTTESEDEYLLSRT